jgi:hypothetical protein
VVRGVAGRVGGWMGVAPTMNHALTIEPGKPLRLRCGLWVHAGVPKREDVDKQWTALPGRSGSNCFRDSDLGPQAWRAVWRVLPPERAAECSATLQGPPGGWRGPRPVACYADRRTRWPIVGERGASP